MGLLLKKIWQNQNGRFFRHMASWLVTKDHEDAKVNGWTLFFTWWNLFGQQKPGENPLRQKYTLPKIVTSSGGISLWKESSQNAGKIQV